MNKKSVAATTVVLFASLVFTVIGVCFSSFVYKDTRILISEVSLASSNGISLYQDKNLTKKATKLVLSDMELGLKPATGEVDAENKIPSTINDQGTSEGYYSTIYVESDVDFKVIVKNIQIKSDKNALDIKKERENIFISIKDLSNSTKSLENEITEIALFQDVSETQKLTFYIWLGAHADKILEGAKISFEISFESV